MRQGRDEEEVHDIGRQPMHALFFQRRDVKLMSLTVTQPQGHRRTYKCSHLIKCHVFEGI